MTRTGRRWVPCPFLDGRGTSPLPRPPPRHSQLPQRLPLPLLSPLRSMWMQGKQVWVHPGAALILSDWTNVWETLHCATRDPDLERNHGLHDDRFASRAPGMREKGPCAHATRQSRAKAPRRACRSRRGGACRRPGIAQGACRTIRCSGKERRVVTQEEGGSSSNSKSGRTETSLPTRNRRMRCSGTGDDVAKRTTVVVGTSRDSGPKS